LTLIQQTPSLVDRVYARTWAVTTRGNDGGGVEELLALANGDAHVLGRVRDRLELLRSQRPLSEHVLRALRLITEAWVTAIGRT